MTSVDLHRPRDLGGAQPLSGACQGGPRHGFMHATIGQRRTPMDGGAYVFRPDAARPNIGTWLWLAEKGKGK